MKFTIIKIISIIMIVFYHNIYAQWSNDPMVNTPVCVWNSFQQRNEIVSDDRGGAIIAWFDLRFGNADIFIQRLDAQGYQKWEDGGKAVCTDSGNQINHKIIRDGEGGCIVVWADDRNGNFDIYAQRVDSSGNILWDSAGVVICDSPLDQEDPQIVPDESGGAIIMWEFKQGTAGETGIYAQRINLVGQVMWTVNGVPVVTSPSSSPIHIKPKISGDGNGGAVIAWIENTLDEYISAQRINSSGMLLWSQNGVPICTSSAQKRFQNLIRVGGSEFILCWNESMFTSDYDFRAQKFDTTGTLLWSNEGIVICSSDVSINPAAIAFDNQNSVIIGWEDHRISGIGPTIYCQKLSLDGLTQWQQNGVAVSSTNGLQYSVKLICDSNGNTVVCWLDARSSFENDIYTQKYDGSGNRLWELEGKEVCIASSSQNKQSMIITNNDDYIVAWDDERNTDWDIYAQSINGLITSVGNSSSQSLKTYFLNQNYPNPFNPSTTIKFSLPISSYTTLKIYNVFGAEVDVFMDNEMNAGSYEIEWNASGLPSGVYFYQLKTKGFVETKKMVLLK